MAFLLVIVALAALIGGPFLIISTVKTMLSKQQDTSSSLTTSELQALIQDAVAEATQPLTDRVAELEQRLEAQEPPEAPHDLLDGTDAYQPETARDYPSRNTVR